MKTVSARVLRIVNGYSRQAHEEGWGVFTCYGSRIIPEGQLRIQKIDCPEEEVQCRERPSDDAAIAYVRRRALAGSKPHQAALRAHCAMPV